MIRDQAASDMSSACQRSKRVLPELVRNHFEAWSGGSWPRHFCAKAWIVIVSGPTATLNSPLGCLAILQVFAGSLNGAGLLRIRVARAGSDTTLARVSATRKAMVLHG